MTTRTETKGTRRGEAGALGVLVVIGMACSSSHHAATTKGDASSGDASSAVDAGTTPMSYPPLNFSDIGTPTKVSDQFYFTEGPVWDPAKGVLYFTDINGDPLDAGSGGASVGGVVYRLTPPSSIDVLFQPAGNTDGLGLDPQGNLLGAGFASRDAWRRTASDGTVHALSPCAQGGGTCYMGTEINTPDDITARSDGTIYFTDPTFASGGQGFPTLDLTLGFQAVFRLTTDGVLHVEDMTQSGPNGVNLSPDEKTLYVSYTGASQVAKFDVAADGSLSNKTTFATGATIADSMCVDAGGNVYVGTISGLSVYDPTGMHLGTISVDGLIVTNCAFGGADQKTLFITSRTQATLVGIPPLGGGLLYQIADMPVPGMPGRN